MCPRGKEERGGGGGKRREGRKRKLAMEDHVGGGKDVRVEGKRKGKVRDTNGCSFSFKFPSIKFERNTPLK